MAPTYRLDRPETFSVIQHIHRNNSGDDEHGSDMYRQYVDDQRCEESLILGFNYCRMYSIREDESIGMPMYDSTKNES